MLAGGRRLCGSRAYRISPVSKSITIATVAEMLGVGALALVVLALVAAAFVFVGSMPVDRISISSAAVACFSFDIMLCSFAWIVVNPYFLYDVRMRDMLWL